MDEVAPWRALEDPAPTSGGEPSAAQQNARSRPPVWVLVAIVAAAVLMAAAFWLAASSGGGTVAVDGSTTAVADPSGDPGLGPIPSSSRAAGKELVVDVQGAVVRPGVLHLPAGSRIGDAIAAAGGFGPRVAADRVGRELNLAALLRDGDQVVVPSRDDSTQPSGAGGPSGAGASSRPGTAAGPIDLNRATVSELDALPGIGPVTANKIVAARDERPFASVDELRSRKILGAATFDKLKDLLVVR
jgi:competence protein ComEA